MELMTVDISDDLRNDIQKAQSRQKDAMRLVRAAIESGTIPGEIGINICADQVTGWRLQEILGPMRDIVVTPGYLVQNRPLFHNGSELLEFIDPEDVYDLWALEV